MEKLDKCLSRERKRWRDKAYGTSSSRRFTDDGESCSFCRPALHKRIAWEQNMRWVLKYSDRENDFNPRL